MAFPAVSPTTGTDAVSYFRNAIVTAGYTPSSALSAQAQLYATVANLMTDIPSKGSIGYMPAGIATGGVVTQATNRTTGVILSKICGAITTHNASLAAEGAAEFTVTNTLVAATDVVVLSIKSGTNSGNTEVFVSTVAAGSFNIKVANNNVAAGTAETGAIIINFAVIKAVAT